MDEKTQTVCAQISDTLWQIAEENGGWHERDRGAFLDGGVAALCEQIWSVMLQVRRYATRSQIAPVGKKERQP